MFDGSHFERMIDEFTSSGWHRIGMNFQFFPVPGGLFSMVCLRDDEQVLGKIRMLEYHAVQGSGVRYMAYEGLHPFYDEPVSLLATGIPEDDITKVLGYQPLGENNTFTNPLYRQDSYPVGFASYELRSRRLNEGDHIFLIE